MADRPPWMMSSEESSKRREAAKGAVPARPRIVGGPVAKKARLLTDGPELAPTTAAEGAAGDGPTPTTTTTKCPYLDTINRHVLDFDFEKVCSISLTNQNVYSCLVCGKFFQGRGRSTHAYTHSTTAHHHLFINLETCRIYCLPDNYEVVDSSLDDIVRCVRPVFSKADVAKLDGTTALARDVHGVSYLPGFCGLNNLKRTDYANAVVHALAHVPPLRDFFLDPDNYARCRSPLVTKFGDLVRKLWSRDNFKSVISPHELVQEITIASKRRFAIGRQADAVEFLGWFLNYVHSKLSRAAGSRGSIVHDAFRGDVRVETLSRKTHLTKRDEDSRKSGDDEASSSGWARTVSDVPYLYLTLDIPPTPLFKDSQGGNIIPQIPLFDVLNKYNGVKFTDAVKAGVQSRRRYVVKSLPDYLIFHFGRFSKNNFYNEKNPTIVNFPVKNLELKDQFAFAASSSSGDDDDAMRGDDGDPPFGTKYDLIANVVHDLPAGLGKQEDPLQFGTYRVHVRQVSSDQWYEIQDLHVSETMPQLIGLSESLLAIYVRHGAPGSAKTRGAFAAGALPPGLG